MFSLIISIIAIALVAALAGASVYYGGSAFNEGTAGADASTFQNAGQQVQAAFTLANVDGDDASSIADLSDGTGKVYLSQTPNYKTNSVTIDGTATDYISVSVTDDVEAKLIERGATDLTTAAAVPSGELLSVNTADNVAFYKVK